MNGRSVAPRPLPSGIERGEAVIGRQGTPRASGFRPRQAGPELAPSYGGGTSPLKTEHPVHAQDVGKVAVWDKDGFLAIAGVTAEQIGALIAQLAALTERVAALEAQLAPKL